MKKQRILAILQLCIVFTIIVWMAGYPFMGALFEQKKETLQYQFVMGQGELIERLNHDAERLTRNQDRFQKLSNQEKHKILTGYDVVLAQKEIPFGEKLKDSLHLLAVGAPPLERAWLILATIAAILILLNRASAKPAAWLTFALAIGILGEAYFFPVTNKTRQSLIPTEKYLIEHYVSSDTTDEYLQLLEGWEHYLVAEWLHETPSGNPEAFRNQVEEGDYRFHLEELNQLIDHPLKKEKAQSASLFAGTLFFLWSLTVARAIRGLNSL